MAGINYGLLYSLGPPLNSFGMGLIVFGGTMGWFGIGFSVLFLFQKRFKRALVVFLATTAIAIGVCFIAA